MHRYTVPEMTCGHCARTIEQAVKRVDAQAEVRVDLATREIEVRSRADAAQIAAAIRDAGYETGRIAGCGC